jgi:hypothetical protein
MKKILFALISIVALSAFTEKDEDVRVELVNNCGRTVRLELPTDGNTTNTSMDDNSRSTWTLRVGEKIKVDGNTEIEVRSDSREIRLCN